MASLFYVWLLLKYRPWQTFQLALGIAVLLIIAVAAISWHQYRTIELNKHKSLFPLQLLLQDGTTHAQAQAIASDLRALAPSLIASVTIVSDSTWRERFQSRYGITLSEFGGDSLFPLVLELRFVPDRMSQSAVAALMEQCSRMEEVSSINYSPKQLASIGEYERDLEHQSHVLAILWLAIATIGQLLHLRLTLPLSRRDRTTLLLLGAPIQYPRRVRMLVAFTGGIWGISIAAAIIVSAWFLHFPYISTYHALITPAIGAMLVLVGVTTIFGWLIEPS
jgi:cell division protein FtsX